MNKRLHCYITYSNTNIVSLPQVGTLSNQPEEESGVEGWGAGNYGYRIIPACDPTQLMSVTCSKSFRSVCSFITLTPASPPGYYDTCFTSRLLWHLLHLLVTMTPASPPGYYDTCFTSRLLWHLLHLPVTMKPASPPGYYETCFTSRLLWHLLHLLVTMTPASPSGYYDTCFTSRLLWHLLHLPVTMTPASPPGYYDTCFTSRLLWHLLHLPVTMTPASPPGYYDTCFTSRLLWHLLHLPVTMTPASPPGYYDTCFTSRLLWHLLHLPVTMTPASPPGYYDTQSTSTNDFNMHFTSCIIPYHVTFPPIVGFSSGNVCADSLAAEAQIVLKLLLVTMKYKHAFWMMQNWILSISVLIVSPVLITTFVTVLPDWCQSNNTEQTQGSQFHVIWYLVRGSLSIVRYYISEGFSLSL